MDMQALEKWKAERPGVRVKVSNHFQPGKYVVRVTGPAGDFEQSSVDTELATQIACAKYEMTERATNAARS